MNICDFCPIFDINMIYKIIAKILVNRLSLVLPHLLLSNQGSFTKGRSIMDNIALVEELVRGFNQKNTPARACLCLDIMKAFDSLNWSVIETTLESFGFFGGIKHIFSVS